MNTAGSVAGLAAGGLRARRRDRLVAAGLLAGGDVLSIAYLAVLR